MEWYVEALELVLNKIVSSQREEARQFLKICFIFTDIESNPEIEFYLGTIEKAHKKFAHYEDGSVSLEKFGEYILPLLIVYAKVTNDERVWNIDVIELMKDIAPLSKEKSFFSGITVKSLEKWERAFLKELNYNLTVDTCEAIRIIGHCKTALPKDLQDYIKFMHDAWANGDNSFLGNTPKALNMPNELQEIDHSESAFKIGFKAIIKRAKRQPIIENFIELIGYCFNQTIASNKRGHRLPFFQMIAPDEVTAAKHFIDALQNSNHSVFTQTDRATLMSNVKLVFRVKDALQSLDKDYHKQLKQALNISLTLKSLSQLMDVILAKEPNQILRIRN